ncbi:condensation domain-containing protein, partial [Massilia aurea]|uniref:condensation domain-containing protein n=1 Tax=Massilia aurea TaxID=373040 RepID=UPI002162EF02
ALAKRHGATLFMTLLAPWSALLARLSGQDDIVIGTPVANRRHRQLEPLIGFFVNTLALRVWLSDTTSADELIEQLKDICLKAFAHQDLPFEEVVEAVNPTRSLSHSPLFQSMLSLNNTPRSRFALPDLTLTSLAAPARSTQFDLSLSLTEYDDVLSGSLEYASDLFDHVTVERFAEYFQT